VHEIEAGDPLERRARDEADAVRAGVAQAAGIGLHVGDELGHRRCRNPGVDDQHERKISDPRQRREIPHRVVGNALEKIGIGGMGAHRGHEDGVAVGRRARDCTRRNRAVCSRLVINHHRLLEGLAQLLADDAGGGIDAAAGGERHDQRDRSAGIVLRLPRGGRQARADEARNEEQRGACAQAPAYFKVLR
jgi:hypothetical protein